MRRGTISIKRRISLVFLLSMLVGMLCLDIAVGFLQAPIRNYTTEKQIKIYGAQIEKILAKGGDREELLEKQGAFFEDYQVRMCVIDKTSMKPEVQYLRYSGRPSRKEYISKQDMELIEIFRAGDQNPMFDTYTQDNGVENMIWISEVEGRYVILYTNLSGDAKYENLIRLFLIFATVMSMVLGMIVWSIITGSFMKEINRMVAVTRKMSRLDFSDKVNYHGRVSDLADLSESIDEMSVRLERNIQELQTEVVRKQDMFRNLSHEIKTPLTTVYGYVESIQMMVKEDPKIDRYCRIILEECTTINRLATEMMELASLEHSSDQYPSEALSIEKVEAYLMDRLHREYVETEFDVSFEPVTLDVSPILLKRALINYIDNAVKYRTPDTRVQVKGTKNGRSYRFEITNQGNPIDPKDQLKLWDAFYLVDKSRKRSGSHGIGLAIVKQIADLYKGNVGVISEEGRNTFYLEIPME